MDVFKPAVVLAAYFTFDLFAGAAVWHWLTAPLLSQLNAALAVHP